MKRYFCIPIVLIRILVVTAILPPCLFAQSTFKFYDDISLPQTDAWNFVRQGEVSPSLYTGTINLSVPIYEYIDKDFSIPIVAPYSSNGNTPNQLPGILGPGLTVAQSFRKNTSFYTIRTTDKNVSYFYFFSPNRPHPQDDSPWIYLNRSRPEKYPGVGLPPK